MLQFAEGSYVDSKPTDELRSVTKDIMAVIKQYKDIFPHVRDDKMMKRISDGCAVWDEGVVITFTQYKRNNTVGGVKCLAGDVMIHQIAAREQGNGSAKRVLEKFIDHCTSIGVNNIYLTVRSENERAINFYKKMGMGVVGELSWKNGTLPGVVMRLELVNESIEAFFE